MSAAVPATAVSELLPDPDTDRGAAPPGPWLAGPWENARSSSGGRWDRPEDRLLAALFLAGAIHAAVILGVSFAKPLPPHTQSSTLDVVLVQTASDHKPDHAAFLAPVNQDGGAERGTDERPASPLPAPFTGPTAEVVTTAPASAPSAPGDSQALPKAPAAAAPTAVLARAEPAPDKATRRPPTPQPRPRELAPARSVPDPSTVAVPPKPEIDAVTLVTKSLAYASLNAELDQRLEEFASKPRRKWITARTRESKYAAYMDAWRAKVERIGNLNYPDAARRRHLAGSLLLDVALNSNGTVHDVVLRRSSGHRILDDAAIRIVKLAAPFAPLPPAIRRETDILHIERTWQFLSSNRLSSP